MTIENLITNLTNQGAKSPLPRPFATFAFCVTFLAIYLVILLQIFGLRDDFSVAINNFSLQLELALNILVIIFALAAISFLRLPSLNKKSSWINYAVITFFILLFISICINCCNERDLECLGSISCLIGILLFSLVPLLFLISVLKRGVMTNYSFSFLIIGIASGSFSYLLERLINKTEDLSHILLWHFAPIFLVILLSALLIKKLVKPL